MSLLTKKGFEELRRLIVSNEAVDLLDEIVSVMDAVDSLTGSLKAIKKHNEILFKNDSLMPANWHIADQALEHVWGKDE